MDKYSVIHRNLRLCGLNWHLLSCKFSGVPGSLTEREKVRLAFAYRYVQLGCCDWIDLFCIRGRKTLPLVSTACYFFLGKTTDSPNKDLLSLEDKVNRKT